MKRKCEGRLIYDSADTGLVTGARSAGRTDRALLFHSADTTLDLMVHTGSNGLCFLQGMIADAGEATPVRDARVRLDREPDAVAPDEHGQFALSTMSPGGDIVLRIETDEAEMVCTIPREGCAVN